MPDQVDVTLCDQCACEVPATDAATCECGEHICDDCRILHDSDCPEKKDEADHD